MRRLVTTLALASLALSCGGSKPTAQGPTATFQPATATAGSIAQLAGSASGSQFSVRIAATDIANFFGAAFRIRIDTDFVAFVGLDSSGSFLRDGGIPVGNLFFRADAATTPGQVIVTATRLQNGGGTLPGVNVTGTRDLVVLTFRVLRTIGATDTDTDGILDGSVEFIDPRKVCDPTFDPGTQDCGPIAVTWASGSVRAN